MVSHLLGLGIQDDGGQRQLLGALRVLCRDGLGRFGEDGGVLFQLLRLLGQRKCLAGQPVGDEAAAQDLVLNRVDDRPCHGDRAVQDRLVGGRCRAGVRERRLVVDGAVGRDADHGVDRGDDVGHVAHVGRDWRAGRVIEHPAEQLGIVSVERGEVGVVDHVRVRGALDHAHGRACGERTRLEAARDELGQLVHACPVMRPDHVERGRVCRDDVRCVAAASDDAVDAVGRQQLLAQESDSGLRDDQGVGGIQASLGEASGVRLATGVGHFQLVHRDDVRRGHVCRPRMDHHRRVDAVEGAGVDEPQLAAAGLLGGRAQDGDAQTELLCDRGECKARPDTGRRDDVVAACVPDLGQRVVLDADRDMEGPRPGASDDRRRQTGDTRLDVEATGDEPLGHPAGRQGLLEADLWIGVDPMAQPNERRMGFLEQLARAQLRVRPIHGSSSRGNGGPSFYATAPWAGLRPLWWAGPGQYGALRTGRHPDLWVS